MFDCVARKKTAANHGPEASTTEAIQRLLALLCCDGIRCRRVRFVLSGLWVILLRFPNVIPRSLSWVKNFIWQFLVLMQKNVVNLLRNICFICI